MFEIELPQLGETVSEGVITAWFKHVGDHVDEGEPLFEVETEKVSLEVPAETSGTLEEITAHEGQTVAVGAVLGLIATSEAVGADPGTKSADAPPRTAPTTAKQALAPSASPMTPPNAVALLPHEPRVLSPMVRKLIKEHDLDASKIEGTGINGRITRRDVELLIERQTGSLGEDATSGGALVSGTIPFNRIRQVTGERMSESRAVAPHAITAMEVDFEAIEEVRTANSARWKEEHGVSLNYLPFICRALSDAISKFPMMNASVGDGELILKEDINLAIAVDLDFEGLLAPVVRNADGKRIVALSREIADLAARARTKRLTADELAGGTFTISNSGSFGTFMVVPIINQPQVAILSTDGVARKPVVVTDDHGRESIAIHSVGMLVLSWDHRAFDGAYAAAFMRQLKKNLETFDWEVEL